MLYKYQYTNSTDRQQIIDGNANKSLIEEDNIADGNFLVFSDQVIEGGDLGVVKSLKISQINNLYNQKLAEGFTSSAGGTVESFGYTQSDQINFMNAALKVLLKGTTAFPINIYQKNGAAVTLDQAQYSQLVDDIAGFFEPLKEKQHDYITQVNACTTIDAVNAITVVF
ncbi:MAG: hypothetical protein Q8911_00070 [Bacillota bacterium]|nr:hypothetical protein [Bacillota bacterium]